jgi:transcriptional antiterminator
MRFLFLARPDSIIPLLVVAPPTSLRELKQYFIRMAGEMVNFASVVTELTLVKDKNSDGITYSRIVPRMVKRLSETEYARVKEYADALRVSVSTVDLNREDWNGGGGEAEL